MSVRLVLADDHEVVRAGVKALLQTDPAFEVIAECSDGDTAVKACLLQRPDVALIDVRMPGCDGLSALARVRLEAPEVPVVMFSGYENPTYAARALALGAAGYLLKSASAAELRDAVREAAGGKTLWGNGNQATVSAQGARPGAAGDLPLTKREVDVLRHLALGLSNREIAQSLSISYETVKEHVQHVLRKLGVADRTQAAVWAVRNGVA